MEDFVKVGALFINEFCKGFCIFSVRYYFWLSVEVIEYTVPGESVDAECLQITTSTNSIFQTVLPWRFVMVIMKRIMMHP